MSKVLLLSHAKLSQEFYETAKLIMGFEDDAVGYITLPYGKDLQEYQNEIITFIENSKQEGVLILTDLFGGSPFMISTQVYQRLHDQMNIEIVTGMNLPMVVEVISQRDTLDVSQLKDLAIEIGGQGIISLSDKLQKEKSEEGGIQK